MATNDFLPFGTGVGANALSQSDYNALAARLSGFSGGIARSPQVNKVWRQSAVMAHVLADVIADFGLDALDNGDLATLKANLLAAIRGVQVRGMTSYAANATFVVPAGVTRIHVRLWGGGGGGGGALGGTSGAAGAGGGGGGYAEGIYSVTPGASLAVVVGAGGGGGVGAANGAAGGSTSIGALCSATGGGGGGGGNGAVSIVNGTPGAGTGGALNYPGYFGGTGYVIGSGTASGFGGGAFGGSLTHPAVATDGLGAHGPGCGGSGAATSAGATGTSRTGGQGAAGLCVISW